METYAEEAVRAAVVRQDGAVLMMRRADGDDFGGVWELPGGSADGEAHSVALGRELGEETGMALLELLGSCHVHRFLTGRRDGSSFGERTYLVRSSGEPGLSGEHDAFGWWQPDRRVTEPCSPSALLVLARLAAN